MMDKSQQSEVRNARQLQAIIQKLCRTFLAWHPDGSDKPCRLWHAELRAYASGLESEAVRQVRYVELRTLFGAAQRDMHTSPAGAKDWRMTNAELTLCVHPAAGAQPCPAWATWY